MTPRQQEALTYILDCWYEGWFPTEMQLALHMHVSDSMAAKYVGALKRDGYLRPTSRIALAEHVARQPNKYA